jgi:acetylornithine deacetylase/succinyl-diaminopimelate desuccinylase-like protein
MVFHVAPCRLATLVSVITLSACAPAADDSRPGGDSAAPVGSQTASGDRVVDAGKSGGDPYVVSAAAPAGFDREAAQRSTQAHLTRLIGLNTQNPPGNEIIVARYLDSVLKRVPGIETRILDAGGGRANFIARLRAQKATGRPVLVMGHMDVVGADTTKWESNAFKAVIRDDYLYGRGAIDDKGMIAATTTALVELAKHRDSLTRDIIFLGTAAEEGGPEVGIVWVLEKHADLIANAEFALNEGGRVRVEDGMVRTVNIQTTEKVPYNVVATAKGPSGHGSVPLPMNALAALARAAERVHAYSAPVKLNETTRIYFERLAQIERDATLRGAMQKLTRSGASESEIRDAAAVLSREPLHNAVLRSGISLTMIDGGIRTNVIPSEGTANFNVRVLPNDDITAVVREMQTAGGEEQVTFALNGERVVAPDPSPVSSALFQSMERAAKAMEPRTTVIPFMSTGATDGAALRAKGIPTYGILPMPLPMEDELRMHGDNERVPVKALGWATEYLYRVLHGVAIGG